MIRNERFILSPAHHAFDKPKRGRPRLPRIRAKDPQQSKPCGPQLYPYFCRMRQGSYIFDSLGDIHLTEFSSRRSSNGVNTTTHRSYTTTTRRESSLSTRPTHEHALCKWSRNATHSWPRRSGPRTSATASSMARRMDTRKNWR
jgi:hypothetical protein